MVPDDPTTPFFVKLTHTRLKQADWPIFIDPCKGRFDDCNAQTLTASLGIGANPNLTN